MNEQEFKEPPLATIFRMIGGFVILIGGFMTTFALIAIFSSPRPAGSGSFFAASISIFVSSLVWFAVAQVIQSLAQTAHNSGKRLTN